MFSYIKNIHDMIAMSLHWKKREREFGEIIAHGEVAVQSHNFN